MPRFVPTFYRHSASFLQGKAENFISLESRFKAILWWYVSVNDFMRNFLSDFYQSPLLRSFDKSVTQRQTNYINLCVLYIDHCILWHKQIFYINLYLKYMSVDRSKWLPTFHHFFVFFVLFDAFLTYTHTQLRLIRLVLMYVLQIRMQQNSYIQPANLFGH